MLREQSDRDANPRPLLRRRNLQVVELDPLSALYNLLRPKNESIRQSRYLPRFYNPFFELFFCGFLFSFGGSLAPHRILEHLCHWNRCWHCCASVSPITGIAQERTSSDMLTCSIEEQLRVYLCRTKTLCSTLWKVSVSIKIVVNSSQTSV